ncbi:hypothetical protein FK220_017170 [Flavobacteriaceae bacterium TP-CH-4]|uniref:Glucosamine inositolphosphorylceramide transferase 1 N-terminal domain-containing protein n=1 Tax=Pelagihabitans pacificus TaxID=2696054 RepID=A0A967AVD9_9FLAO|nr:hypothetical protein [Pelagihabitans pacificus]NHF61086.1 hypothetical protein [Pelagihabitans pacificus]
MTKQKLKIGLLLDDHNIPAWVYKMVEMIGSSKHSEISLIVKKTRVTNQNGDSAFRRIWRNRNVLLYKLYSNLDYKIFKWKPDAFERKNILNLVNCKEIEVNVGKNLTDDHLLPEDISRINEKPIDVFINIGFQSLQKEVIKIPKYGIWTYRHDTYQNGITSFSGVWEVLEQEDITEATLEVLTADGNKILYRSYSHTDELSVYRNKNNFYWKSSSFVPRKLEELYRLGEKTFLKNIDQNNTELSSVANKKLKKAPGNYEILIKIGANYLLALKRKVRRMFYIKQWILLYKVGTSPKIPKSFFDYNRIVPPKDRIWADPFVLFRDGKYFVFIEEMLYAENKGKISVIEINKNGKYEMPKVIIENNYHMSYPLLFEDGDDLFMLPETGANLTIELYKCVDFPLRWEFHSTLMENVRAADATLFKYKGRYWLFTNMREVQGASVQDELFLFYSDDFQNGTWQSHPENPIVSDVRCSRPAGNIFEHEGRIYRPAQNGGKHYGYGMQINEIVTLTEEFYQEREVQSIHPNWAKDLIGTHTLNADGGLTVIDALIKRRK